jgi:hypothetical protein
MRILAVVGALAIVLAIAAGVFFFGGFYNVAASEEESGPVAWALQRVRQASIARRAAELRPPMSLDDPAVVQAGARAFGERGCKDCHGAPGVEWEKYSEGMQPDPPNLKEVAEVLTPGEIFWAVKNGIRMTGMPSFALIKAEDREIWSIAAFVKKFASVSPEQYKTWTAPAGSAADSSK